MNDGERQRLLAQYAEIAAMAGGLAHEIKNPLSTIGMNLELMSEELRESESPENRRLLNKVDTIQKECLHLEEVLNAFMQFASVGEMDRVQVNVNDLVEEFIQFYQPQADEAGIEVSPHLAANLPPVEVDPSLMRQVFMNLVLNAQQAMPDGGTLELQTYEKDGRVHLNLIDNGSGMSPQTMNNMFKTFFSTKPTGNGLGLPTVKKIIEAHAGTITCESADGSGTRFTISLPAANQTQGTGE